MCISKRKLDGNRKEDDFLLRLTFSIIKLTIYSPSSHRAIHKTHLTK